MTPHVSIALLRTQTDARLASLAAGGHDRAFEAIVERYRAPLLRYARSFRLDAGAAEDVVQASCLAAWAALRDGSSVHDLRPWLYRIVHNRSINALRASSGGPALADAADAGPSPQDDVEAREQVRDTLDGIAALPERQRAALVAVAIDGRAHADVGQELGVSDMAVRKLVSRARGSLRAAATAITPMPVATWLAQAPGSSDHAVRIGELVTAGGTASFAGASVLKAGAVAVTIGAVAAGTPHLTGDDAKPARRAAATAQAHAVPAAPSAITPTTRLIDTRAPSSNTTDDQAGSGSGSRPHRGSESNGPTGSGHHEAAGSQREDRFSTPGGSRGDDESSEDGVAAPRHRDGRRTDGDGGSEDARTPDETGDAAGLETPVAETETPESSGSGPSGAPEPSRSGSTPEPEAPETGSSGPGSGEPETHDHVVTAPAGSP